MSTLKQRWGEPRIGVLAVTVLAALGVVASGLLGTSGSRAAAPAVSVFPSPGDRVASPFSQLTFRGIPIAQLGSITVTGSKSGVHSGTVQADSDGDGGSFLPSEPFATGEKVTVSTSQAIAGVKGGTYSFTVLTPANAAKARPLKLGARTKGDVWNYVSRPDLKPAAVTVTTLPHGSQAGDLFIGPQAGPLQNGVELLGPYGGLVYFKPVPKGQYVTDFETQSYGGRPVLTWWQGNVSASGVGAGQDQIYDSSYRPLATIRAGNGLYSDLHEFQITPQGNALVTAYQPVTWDASKVKGGSKNEVVLDSIVQEIDIKTGLVLFQWNSLDHVALGDSLSPVAKKNVPWDYFHVNSIEQEGDGSFVVSSRNTTAVYRINGQTGAVQWTLGGKRSSFKMAANTSFYFQHDARMQSNNEITVFDDAGAPFREKQSRGLTLKLDTTKRSATLAAEVFHRPALLAPAEGNMQRLANGDDLVGWGQANNFTEFNAKGREVFDARFIGGNSSYRAYRYEWTGTPVTLPAVAAKTSRRKTTVYASWNGSTALNKWRVLGGPSATNLKSVAVGSKRSFETSFRLGRSYAYVAVQALDNHGKVLGTSKTIKNG
jgi:hypothetical protein